MSYRVMVEGEDGQVFCHKNSVDPSRLQKELMRASSSYEHAMVWAEDEDPYATVMNFPQYGEDRL